MKSSFQPAQTTASDSLAFAPTNVPSGPQQTNSRLTLAISGQGVQRGTIDITDRQATVGSDENCSIRFASNLVAPQEVIITRGRERTFVDAINSETKLNGQKFTRQWLKEGDCLTCGSIDLQVLAIEPLGVKTAVVNALANGQPSTSPTAPSREEMLRSLKEQTTQLRAQLEQQRAELLSGNMDVEDDVRAGLEKLRQTREQFAATLSSQEVTCEDSASREIVAAVPGNSASGSSVSESSQPPVEEPTQNIPTPLVESPHKEAASAEELVEQSVNEIEVNVGPDSDALIENVEPIALTDVGVEAEAADESSYNMLARDSMDAEFDLPEEQALVEQFAARDAAPANCQEVTENSEAPTGKVSNDDADGGLEIEAASLKEWYSTDEVAQQVEPNSDAMTALDETIVAETEVIPVAEKKEKQESTLPAHVLDIIRSYRQESESGQKAHSKELSKVENATTVESVAPQNEATPVESAVEEQPRSAPEIQVEAIADSQIEAEHVEHPKRATPVFEDATTDAVETLDSLPVKSTDTGSKTDGGSTVASELEIQELLMQVMEQDNESQAGTSNAEEECAGESFFAPVESETPEPEPSRIQLPSFSSLRNGLSQFFGTSESSNAKPDAESVEQIELATEDVKSSKVEASETIKPKSEDAVALVEATDEIHAEVEVDAEVEAVAEADVDAQADVAANVEVETESKAIVDTDPCTQSQIETCEASEIDDANLQDEATQETAETEFLREDTTEVESACNLSDKSQQAPTSNANTQAENTQTEDGETPMNETQTKDKSEAPSLTYEQMKQSMLEELDGSPTIADAPASTPSLATNEKASSELIELPAEKHVREPEEQSNQDSTEEESIESYMQKLLNRSGGNPAAETKQLTPKPAPQQVEAEPKVEVRDVLAKTFATEVESHKQKLEPVEISPHSLPELETNYLDDMRAMSRESAKEAIEESFRRKTYTAATVQLGLALCSLLAGLIQTVLSKGFTVSSVLTAIPFYAISMFLFYRYFSWRRSCTEASVRDLAKEAAEGEAVEAAAFEEARVAEARKTTQLAGASEAHPADPFDEGNSTAPTV